MPTALEAVRTGFFTLQGREVGTCEFWRVSIFKCTLYAKPVVAMFPLVQLSLKHNEGIAMHNAISAGFLPSRVVVNLLLTLYCSELLSRYTPMRVIGAYTWESKLLY